MLRLSEFKKSPFERDRKGILRHGNLKLQGGADLPRLVRRLPNPIIAQYFLSSRLPTLTSHISSQFPALFFSLYCIDNVPFPPSHLSVIILFLQPLFLLPFPFCRVLSPIYSACSSRTFPSAVYFLLYMYRPSSFPIFPSVVSLPP